MTTPGAVADTSGPYGLVALGAPEVGMMPQYDDTPVLVDRAEACILLGVSDTTFARLCREGRFENMCCGGGDPVYRSAELRAYRAQDKRLGASQKGVTNAAGELKETAPLRVTSEREIGAGEGERPRTTNDTWPVCEGCQKPFRPHRAGQRVCSTACRQRARRARRAAA